VVLCAAKIQQMKHSVSKGDKKKKKDVVAQTAVLEAELEARHGQELKAFEQDTPKAVSLVTLCYIILCIISCHLMLI